MPSCDPCLCCKCKKNTALKPCYKQPKVVESFAPNRPYVKPTMPLEDSTTYKLSYLTTRSGDTRAEPIRPGHCIIMSSEPMEDTTVHQLSYRPNQVCVTRPALPRNHQMFSTGPVSAITTQKHDYGPKPIEMRESFRPDSKYHFVEAPFESMTVNRLSYLNPGRVQPVTACKPISSYQKPETPIESTTTQKISYQPVKYCKRMIPPWASKGQYVTPTFRMEDNTVYRTSFLPPGEDCSALADPEQSACDHSVDTTPPTEPCTCKYPKAECCARAQ